MAQEVDAVCSEHALPRVDLQPGLPQSLEDMLQVLKMFLQIVAPHDDVVKVALDEGKAPQYFVHPALEVGGRILYPEGDHQPFP